MVNYLRAEEMGMTDQLAVLSTSDRKLFRVQTMDHLKDLQSIYDNTPNVYNQFLSCIRDMGKRRITKQYIVKNKNSDEVLRSFIEHVANIELDDNTKIENAFVPCTLPQTIMYGGEVMMSEDVISSEENFKNGKEKLNAVSKDMLEIIQRPIETAEDTYNFINAVRLKCNVDTFSEVISEAASGFKKVRDDTRFKKLEHMKYNQKCENVTIDDNDYTKLGVSGFGAEGVIRAFSLEPSYFAILEGNVKGSIYKVKVTGERALKNISRNIGENEVLEGVLDFIRQANVRDCCDFTPSLLEKSDVSIESVHSIAEAKETQTICLGSRKVRTFDLIPKKSFVTLYNGLERRTVALPTYMGVGFNLSMSDSLNVKIEEPIEIPIS
jgi:hypothetical protein